MSVDESVPVWCRYAIRVPSGDHVGSKSAAGSWVIRLRLVPFASMTYTSSSWGDPPEKPIRPRRDERWIRSRSGPDVLGVVGDGLPEPWGASGSEADGELHAARTTAEDAMKATSRGRPERGWRSMVLLSTPRIPLRPGEAIGSFVTSRFPQND